jgi:hypothetical protein
MNFYTDIPQPVSVRPFRAVVFRVFQYSRLYNLHFLEVCFQVAIGKIVHRPARLGMSPQILPSA